MLTTVVLFHLSLLALNLLQEDIGTDFQELGRWLLGGFIAAVVLAIAFTFIKLRLKDRKPPAEFISISSGPRSTESKDSSN